ncbi:hypothetical protein BV25DRAFT_1328084 [Artomyces pyxidatus]|uniref:Uncharacterized protein n=1 Tax=Artomyces pyxidatus TaxID=48021 RepID=A0ACB8SP83_9AGAM|nr:hypothetical protein BV25DRAFT_1328084 [Artomyces pyxidatus]
MSFDAIVRKKRLFAPANGEYTREDRARCFAQQPLDLMPTYLAPILSTDPIYIPPLLHYGWTTTVTELMDLVIKICPEEIRYLKLKTGPVVSPARTLSTRRPIIAFLRHIGVPDDERIEYMTFQDSQSRVHAGIAAGNNYSGLPVESIPKLSEFFGKGETGKYYLDRKQWKWVIEPLESSGSSDKPPESESAAVEAEDRETTPTPASVAR